MNQPGGAEHGGGEQHAPGHAAGELEGELVEVAGPHAEALGGPGELVGVGPGAGEQLPADPHERIEVADRLRDEREPGAPQRPRALGRERSPVVGHRPDGPGVARQQAHDGVGQERLARAGGADDAEDPPRLGAQSRPSTAQPTARRRRERYIMKPTRRPYEADPQAVDLEEGHHELLVLRRGRADEGLQGVAAAVDDQDDGQQLAGDAEAEEGQAGLVQDRVREHEHRAHQGLRHDVGREVRPGDEPSAAPHLTRGDDVRAGPQVDRLGAHDAGEGDPVGRRDADHDAGDAAPDEDREEGHEDEVGHALHEVDEPQDDPVDPAAADGGAAPSSRTMRVETSEADRPMRIEIDRPLSVRMSMSRPIQSVPNGLAAEGGRSARSKGSGRAGSCGGSAPPGPSRPSSRRRPWTGRSGTSRAGRRTAGA